jgi:hypothetical protein
MTTWKGLGIGGQPAPPVKTGAIARILSTLGFAILLGIRGAGALNLVLGGAAEHRICITAGLHCSHGLVPGVYRIYVAKHFQDHVLANFHEIRSARLEEPLADVLTRGCEIEFEGIKSTEDRVGAGRNRAALALRGVRRARLGFAG